MLLSGIALLLLGLFSARALFKAPTDADTVGMWLVGISALYGTVGGAGILAWILVPALFS